MTNSNEDKLAFLDAPAADNVPAPQETPAAEPPQPETPPAPSAQEAAPAATPSVTPTAPGQATQEPSKADHTVPLPKYLDTYNESRELKKQLAEMQAQLQKFQQPQTQAPDPLLDPKGYGEHIKKEVWQQAQQEITQTRLNISEQMARQVHGDQTVSEAQQAFEAAAQKAPWIVSRVMNSQHPWNEMVAWHKQEKLLGEIGDPSKLNDWILSRAAALNPAAQPAAASIPAPVVAPSIPPVVVAPPPSLSRAPAAAKPSEAPVGPGQAFSGVFG